MFVSQLRTNASWRPALSGAVAGTVAMVPEGLVLLTSIAFSAAVVRLARRRVLVQELPAVEGLARVDVLCIDKTGTLTEGRLSVERIERIEEAVQPAPVLAALAAADPSPNATVRALGDRFGDPPDWPVDDTVPFSSARKWSAVRFTGEGTWVLGAPDVLTDDAGVLATVGELAAAGARIVLLARADDLDDERRPPGIEPVALVVLADQPRPDAAETLRYFAEQQVSIRVLSGDAPATVGAIAAGLGVPNAGDPVDARTLDDDALGAALEEHAIFGRVTPQQKRSMVLALQAAGHTVAMTGDGVNDALALKEADLGIAMGDGSRRHPCGRPARAPRRHVRRAAPVSSPRAAACSATSSEPPTCISTRRSTRCCCRSPSGLRA